MDQQLVRDQHTGPDHPDHHQTTPEQQTEPEQQQTLEQEPTSDQEVPRDQQIPPTPESNEEALHQHQKFLRSSYPSADFSEISYHTNFPGSRHSSLNTEPLTLDADQMHEAKDQAGEIIETVDPQGAFDIFTKNLQTESEEAVTQETEAQAFVDQINTLVDKAQQVVEANEQQQSKFVDKNPGEVAA